jgi:D-methionine transport system ATP-binding protein
MSSKERSVIFENDIQIRLIDLHKSYPNLAYPALDRINLSFERGKIHSIIGRSGAGKSTLLRCLNHLDRPDRGDIIIDGFNLSTSNRAETRRILQTIGTVFQKVNLLSRRTVLQNVLLPLEWRGDAHTKASRDKVHSLLKKLGLSGLEDRYPAQLSGGQAQRVAIARALATDAKLLLCDEFTSALDPETSLEILSLLRHINRTLGITVILITHDMSVVREISDSIYVMEKGQIVESGALERVLLHPQHGVTKSLLQNLFTRELPEPLQKQLQNVPPLDRPSQTLIRLIFSGEVAQRPLITDLIREEGVSVNILAGHLDHLREKAFGDLLVAIPNKDHQMATALAYFEEHGVSAEIMGYLRREDG